MRAELFTRQIFGVWMQAAHREIELRQRVANLEELGSWQRRAEETTARLQQTESAASRTTQMISDAFQRSEVRTSMRLEELQAQMSNEHSRLRKQEQELIGTDEQEQSRLAVALNSASRGATEQLHYARGEAEHRAHTLRSMVAQLPPGLADQWLPPPVSSRTPEGVPPEGQQRYPAVFDSTSDTSAQDQDQDRR